MDDLAGMDLAPLSSNPTHTHVPWNWDVYHADAAVDAVDIDCRHKLTQDIHAQRMGAEDGGALEC